MVVSANADSSNPRGRLRDQLLGADRSDCLAGLGLGFELGDLDIDAPADTMRIFDFLCA